jgi:hypothetical protein
MKETLTLTGRVELTRPELTQAINEWLQKTKKLSITRAIYVTEGNTVKSGVFEVKQDVSVDRTIPEFSMPRVKEVKEERNMPSGWKRINVGVFQTIKELIEDYRKRGLKEVDFDTLLEDVTFFHQRMDKKRLEIYIRDSRQLKGIKYSSRDKRVTF